MRRLLAAVLALLAMGLPPQPGFAGDRLRFRSESGRLTQEPAVVVEWLEALPECARGKVCFQGQVKNDGPVPAYGVWVRMDVGSTRHIPPVTSVRVELDSSRMDPGDRQEFYAEIPRRLRFVKDGRRRTAIVGRYNVKAVPSWSGR